MLARTRSSRIFVILLCCAATFAATQSALAQSGVGACCLPNGTNCVANTSAASCAQLGGTLLDGQTCSSCSQTGACCAGTSCTMATPGGCATAQGQYFGGSCTAGPCPSAILIGSCCNPAGGCVSVLANSCVRTSSWSASVACASSPCLPLGACCFAGAGCSFVVKSACIGAWYANTSCAAANCGPSGACCNLQTNVCSNTTAANCPPASQFIVNASCANSPCQPKGACCTRNNFCTESTNAECAAISGHFSPNLTCNPSPCPGPLGACCIPGIGGGCAFISKSDCPNGSSFAANTPCLPDPCPNTQGACCTASGCAIATSAANCSGTFFPAQACADDLCPSTGACCSVTGGCGTTTIANCTGVWYAAAPCSPTPCANTGACCSISGACNSTTAFACSGTWYAKAACAPEPCQKGACCNTISSVCAIAHRQACDQQALSWMGFGITCQPANCAAITGVCCFTGISRCTMTTMSQCSAGKWITNSTCQPNPCCAADYNGSAALEVGDIFLFLSTWFAGCP